MSTGTPATPDPGPPPSLPADRAFVLQFRARAGADGDGPWAGRVEHVVTGHAARFEDWAALRAFIEQTLSQQRRPGQA